MRWFFILIVRCSSLQQRLVWKPAMNSCQAHWEKKTSQTIWAIVILFFEAISDLCLFNAWNKNSFAGYYRRWNYWWKGKAKPHMISLSNRSNTDISYTFQNGWWRICARSSKTSIERHMMAFKLRTKIAFASGEINAKGEVGSKFFGKVEHWWDVTRKSISRFKTRVNTTKHFYRSV